MTTITQYGPSVPVPYLNGQGGGGSAANQFSIGPVSGPGPTAGGTLAASGGQVTVNGFTVTNLGTVFTIGGNNYYNVSIAVDGTVTANAYEVLVSDQVGAPLYGLVVGPFTVVSGSLSPPPGPATMPCVA